MSLKVVKISPFVLALSLFLSMSCAHHRDVRPGDDGIHKVILNVNTRDEGFRAGMREARHYCGQWQKEAIVVAESTNYTGNGDEESYNRNKKIAKGASVVGGATWIFGGKTESAIGGVVGLGGLAADQIIGQGYKYAMKFKCKHM